MKAQLTQTWRTIRAEVASLLEVTVPVVVILGLLGGAVYSVLPEPPPPAWQRERAGLVHRAEHLKRLLDQRTGERDAAHQRAEQLHEMLREEMYGGLDQAGSDGRPAPRGAAGSRQD